MSRTQDIHGVTFTHLANRTIATLRQGDVIRTDISPMGTRGLIFQYLTVMSTPQEIRATRQRRGLPFHRIPSVLVTLRGFNGDIPETPENMRDEVAGPYYIAWPARFNAVNGAASGKVNHQTERFDADARFDIFRRV